MDGHEAEPRVLLHLVSVRREGDAIEEFGEAKALAFQLRRGGDELFQIADAAFGFQRAFIHEALQVAALHHDPAHETAEGERGLFLRRAIEEGDEAGQLALGATFHFTGAEQRDDALQRRAIVRHGGFDAPERRRTHAPTGRVHAAAEGGQIEGVLHQAQIGEKILHLLPLVELHAADELVGDVQRPQRVLDLAALPVGAVEHGHARLAVPLALGKDHARQPLRLGAAIVRQLEDQPLALTAIRPQRLAQTLRVVGDDRAGRVQDALRGAVVLLQLDLRRLREVPLEVEDVADVRSAPSIDRIVGGDAIRHEGVDARDIEIEDLALHWDALHLRHGVVALGCEQGHAILHIAGGQEGQARALAAAPCAQAGLEHHFGIEVLLDALGVLQHAAEILGAGLETPTP